jgi:hypothetical protein
MISAQKPFAQAIIFALALARATWFEELDYASWIRAFRIRREPHTIAGQKMSFPLLEYTVWHIISYSSNSEMSCPFVYTRTTLALYWRNGWFLVTRPDICKTILVIWVGIWNLLEAKRQKKKIIWIEVAIHRTGAQFLIRCSLIIKRTYEAHRGCRKPSLASQMSFKY